MLNVNIAGNSVGEISGTYYIYDIATNQMVMDNKFMSNEFVINIAGLKNGIYILKLITGNNDVLRSRFIVLK